MTPDAADSREPPAASRKRGDLGLPCALALTGLVVPVAQAVTVGADVDVTSDYIYRGLSESGDHPALQMDLHASTAGGTFGGVFASSLDRHVDPYAAGEADPYLGQRFMLDSSWNAALTAYSHNYVGGAQEASDDYQELAASISYMDLWTASLSAVPNAVRYADGHRAGRYPGYIAETSAQWLMATGLFLTGGVGYYSVDGGTYRISGNGPLVHLARAGYAYGNVGLAYQYRRWRLDVGYFLTEHQAQELFPYPTANRHVAATLSWQF